MGKVEQLMALADRYAFLNRTPADHEDELTPARVAQSVLAHALTAALADERQKALEEGAVVCMVKVDRDPEYGGRWGGYGPWQGFMEGPECAAAIRQLKERT